MCIRDRLDISIITAHKGFVVYASGDDLLAFTPVKKVLEAVYASRRIFAGAPYIPENIDINLSNGFIKIKNSIFPMLPSVGKSYCIYVAHYHYPLSTILKSSYKLLNYAKDEIELRFADNKDKKLIRDILAIGYSPRGEKERAYIPITLSRPIIPYAKQALVNLKSIANVIYFSQTLLNNVLEKKISRSFLYDFLEYADIFKDIIKSTEDYTVDGQEALNIVIDIVKYIIKRNSNEDIAEQLFKTESKEIIKKITQLRSKWSLCLRGRSFNNGNVQA